MYGIREIKTLPPVEIKVDLESGTFEGYAAAYGNVDREGDRLLYGSGKHIADANPTLPIFYQHNWKEGHRPIGKSLYFEERTEGLFTKGMIFDTPAGIETRVGMHEGVLNCLSIGWKPVERKMVKEGGRTVREVSKYDIGEYSVCTKGFSMNDQALITAVKSRIGGKARSIDGITGLIDIGGSPSWESIIDAVRVALRADVDVDDDHGIYIVDISASAVVYEVYSWESGSEDLYTVTYSIDDAGMATITGTPEPTVVRATYETSDAAPAGKTVVHEGAVSQRDYKAMRSFLESSDPIATLLDEAAYLQTLAKEIKAEGREEEVRRALADLDAAALLLKGHCAAEDIQMPNDDADIIEAIRATTLSIREASQELVS
jgi:HK97 family phage prohead protease